MVLADYGSSLSKIDNYATGTATDLDEACWTVIGPNDDRLYVSSFGANIITPFSISGTSISAKLPVEGRSGNAPTGDSKDMYVTSDNKYLYHIGAFQSYSMIIFDVTANGLDYREQVILSTTQAGIGTIGEYNFLGLAGFDK